MVIINDLLVSSTSKYITLSYKLYLPVNWGGVYVYDRYRRMLKLYYRLIKSVNLRNSLVVATC